VVEILKPDICVIGGGSAGLSVAAAAAAFGVFVVLVERHKMGGDCLNTGCVPSKALLAAAKHAHAMQAGGPFGVTAAGVDIDFAKVRAHVQSVIASIAPVDAAERFTGLGVRVIKGHATFKDKRTVSVDGKIEIRARRFVIASGSTPAMPPISGLDGGPYLTNESIFDIDTLPAHLVVIGGGPIGMELAQAFRRLGSAVTVCETMRPLGKDDPECAAIVCDQFERDGVVLRTGVKVTSVTYAAGKVMLTVEGQGGEEKIEGTHLLVAAGRSPTVDGLNLDNARIKYDGHGIHVGKNLKTSNRRVYAIGDCAAGQLRFTHAANYHAGLVIRNALFRLPVKVNNDAVPWVTYTEPELAQTGLSEAEARKRGLKFRILRWPYHDNDRAQAERATHGHIKIITSRKGAILGATIVGAQAGELITTWTLAIAQKLNIRAMTGIVVPYPTLSEIGKRAAIDFFSPSLTKPVVRRIIRWLRLFG
jgi:pyruvate/2-oxoglutarate dehydrogenase complex dihydrolipoamide dehydrogenase (E3) component